MLTLLPRRLRLHLLLLVASILAISCAHYDNRNMEVTAYCGCGECNGYTRGKWYLLKLDVWNRYVVSGPNKGSRYTGKTASGRRLKVPHPGLLSEDSLANPWMIPVRAVLPWCWLPQDGTIAADTQYYPFGTRMYIDGWGWGSVQDRGSAIKGPDKIDIFKRTHWGANKWGRQWKEVVIERPGE